ncbi:MAG: 2-oxoglutarate dehydrogenase E1 component [Flammeovirgaceae bacterium]
MSKYSYISNADSSYIDKLYQSYKQDPQSVDKSWQLFFEGFDFSLDSYGQDGASLVPDAVSREKFKKEIAVRNLIEGYRSRGHLQSKTNPVRQRKDRKARLELADFGLSEADLDTVFEAGEEIGIGAAPLRKIIDSLKKIYEGSIGFEYKSLREPETYNWFLQKVEKESLNFQLSVAQKERILHKLNEAVVFENFLHTKFVGQKRFSLEGGESTIPALDAAINTAAELGVKEVIIGMAHRGRLNVLTNIMGKTYDQVFAEFEGKNIQEDSQGDGDVKYHMGYSSQIIALNNSEITLNLLPNPSHLEAVNPVVMGNARAKIDTIYGGDSSKMMPILIHGDGAIAGQGIVYECTQMSNLRGYSVGGTIHFIINNQVAFTTDFEDSRSSIYCTDVSSMLEAPEIHVNGDDPEAVVFAMKLAVEFRQKYKSDVFVDMVCYRRHGHNESDEPKFTQPKLYNIIAKHPNPRDIYAEKLYKQNSVDADLAKRMDEEFRKLLDDRLNNVRQNTLPYKPSPLEKAWERFRRSKPEDFDQSPETGVPQEVIDKVGKAISTVPDTFQPLKQIQKLLKDRHQMFFEDKVLNWSAAELLAYGSLLLEGKIVRLSGQDVERGTFSHRHAVLNDSETNEKYCALNNMDAKQGKFMIYNSLLSEYGVLGFEYGYALANPDALTIWEAQFGDFANGAQIMIDQFIVSGESKWNRMNGLVMLLPHGYEGQGPEHSNARPERFLQLSAEYNIIVANVTSPSNFFHLLRRQLAWEFRKPCIVMSPKSLLRHEQVISPISEFTSGRFREVIGDDYAKPLDKVEKVLLCTGKIYFELLKKQQEDKRKDVAIIRLEQLHPFPEKQLDSMLDKYKNLKKLIWVQEEPVNMGYWVYILRTYYKRKDLEIVSRKPSASPATGYLKSHSKEQEKIINAAFNR